jgi:hypothetical protein
MAPKTGKAKPHKAKGEKKKKEEKGLSLSLSLYIYIYIHNLVLLLFGLITSPKDKVLCHIIVLCI